MLGMLSPGLIMCLWGALFVIAIVVELLTPDDLIIIWVAVGALGAFIASWLGGPFWLQLLLFVILTGAAILLSRPLVQKMTKNEVTHTNADRVIGMEAVITVAFKGNEIGQSKINDQLWRTTTMEVQENFEVGETVIVKALSGTKLVVEKKDKNIINL